MSTNVTASDIRNDSSGVLLLATPKFTSPVASSNLLLDSMVRLDECAPPDDSLMSRLVFRGVYSGDSEMRFTFALLHQLLVAPTVEALIRKLEKAPQVKSPLT